MAHANDAMVFCFGRDYHCGLLGYQPKKKPQPLAHQLAPNSKLDPVPGICRPVMLAKNSSSAIGVKASSAAGVSREVSAVSNHLPTKSGISSPSLHQNTEGKNSNICSHIFRFLH